MFPNWEQGNGWDSSNPNWTINGDYGFIHVYGLTMTLGVVITALLAYWNFYKRRLPMWSAGIGVVVIVPMGLIGGSFFGKLNADGIGQNASGCNFFECFEFWKAGMSIHGAILFGVLSGIALYSIIGRKSRVSVWTYMDSILPHVLLGQAIGRWGNFFNHEVMGAPIAIIKNGKVAEGTHLHLFDWILVNTQMYYSGPSTTINGLKINSGDLVQMDPIFLWESLSFIAAWIIIVIVLPNLFKWIGKKPWNNGFGEKYSINTTIKKFFNPNGEYKTKTFGEVWDEAFYFNNSKKHIAAFKLKYDGIPNFLSIERWKFGNDQLIANNPEGYAAPKAGVQGGLYFFAWNIVRFFMEAERPNDHLFIMYEKTASLTLVMSLAILGILIVIWCQTIGPRMFRKPGFMYEKLYFELD